MTRPAATKPSSSFGLARRVATLALLGGCLVVTGCKKEATTPPPDEPDPEVKFKEPPIEPLDERVEASQAMLGKGQYQEALDAMDEALVDEPDNADLHFGRGAALSFLERDDEAMAAYDRALELNPDLVPALVARGNMHAFALGDAEAAMPDFDKAVALAPKFAPGFHGRGVLRLDANDVPGAVADLSEAARLDPKNVNTLYVLAQAHAAAGDAKSALDAATKAVALEEGVSGADLRLLKAKLHVATGDNASAITEYEALAALVPDAHDVRLQVGRGILQAGDPAKAATHFEAVATALPEEPAPLVNWARALAAAGDTDGALAKLDAALALKKDLPAAHVYKVEILSAAGKCKEAGQAQKAFEKVGGDEATLARGRSARDACK